MKNNPWSVFHSAIQHDPGLVEGRIRFFVRLTDGDASGVTVDLSARPPTCRSGLDGEVDVSLTTKTETLRALFRDPGIANHVFFATNEIGVDTSHPDLMGHIIPSLAAFIGAVHSLGDDRGSAEDVLVHLDRNAQVIALDGEDLLVRSSLGARVSRGIERESMVSMLRRVDGQTKLSELLAVSDAVTRQLLQLGVLCTAPTPGERHESQEVQDIGDETLDFYDNDEAAEVLLLGNGQLARALHSRLIKEGRRVLLLNLTDLVVRSRVGTKSAEWEKVLFHADSMADGTINDIAWHETEASYISGLRRAGRVVCALEGASYALYLRLAEIAETADVPFLPVTLSGGTVEVGPTLLRNGRENFCLGRLPAELGQIDARAGLLTTHRCTGVGEEALAAASEAVSDFAASEIDCFLMQMKKYREAAASGFGSQDAPRGNVDTSKHVLADLGGGVLDYSRNSSSDRFSIHRYLNPEIFSEPEQLSKIRTGLAADGAVVIRDAFRSEFAEELYQALDDHAHWKPYESYAAHQFHYHHHNIFPNDPHPDKVMIAKMIFSSLQSRRFFQELASIDAMGEPEFIASNYFPGDYSTPHNDWGLRRRVAWIWHLTRNWDLRWGGDLYWAKSDTLLSPMFNTLTLFRVNNHSTHCVLPVTPTAKGKRLTLNGWYCSSGKSLWDEQRSAPDLSQPVTVL